MAKTATKIDLKTPIVSLPEPAPKKVRKPYKKREPKLSIHSADSVIDQTKLAFSVSAIGSITGIVLGSVVPLMAYMEAHYELHMADAKLEDYWSIYTVLTLGGMLFSAKSVFYWTKSAFKDSMKAFGFVCLVEGSMIFSHISWVGWLGLAILIGINAIASAANLVLKPKEEWKLE
jgi:hypothetical protein